MSKKGVVLGVYGCLPVSEMINDPFFWRFSINNASMSVLTTTSTQAPNTTSQTLSIINLLPGLGFILGSFLTTTTTLPTKTYTITYNFNASTIYGEKMYFDTDCTSRMFILVSGVSMAIFLSIYYLITTLAYFFMKRFFSLKNCDFEKDLFNKQDLKLKSEKSTIDFLPNEEKAFK
jgi:hypothetical protein